MEEAQNVVPSAVDRLKAADPKLAKRALAARVEGKLVDLSSLVSDGMTVEAITTESPEALEIYRHSTAHLLAAAVLELFPGTKLGVGPALRSWAPDVAAAYERVLADGPRVLAVAP